MSGLLQSLEPAHEAIRPGMLLIRGFAEPAVLLPLIADIANTAPFRTMTTPRGQTMSVAMTNCGPLGWVTDRRGYRYESCDPLTGAPWPALPRAFMTLAIQAAGQGGFPGFVPDACLINRYGVGARMAAHQDRDERNLDAPIVSVSLGLPATFFEHEGEQRGGRARSVRLLSGDVVVWGGPARLAYHGIRDLKPGADPLCGPFRYNLTFRQAQ